MWPTAAGWYAGQDVWASVHGPEMTLAGDACWFDVSPAWLSWVGRGNGDDDVELALEALR